MCTDYCRLKNAEKVNNLTTFKKKN